MSLTRVQQISISLDGFATGEGQSLEEPFGHAGERLHEWMFGTRWWKEEPGGTYRFQTAFGAVEGEFREVEPPERLVQTFQNHLQTLEFEDLGERTKLTQTMRFATTEERDTTMQYGVEEGAKSGFARVDELLQRLPSRRG